MFVGFRFLPETGNVLMMQGLCVTDETSRETLRFGKISLLGNLEKLLEAITGGETKFKSELAVPWRGGASGYGTDVHQSRSGCILMIQSPGITLREMTILG